jgi:beta-galactosidase GanA
MARKRGLWVTSAGLALLAGTAAAAAAAAAWAADTPLPRIERKGDNHALIVDGAPFLLLGAQANNSSNYPSALPKVWPMLDRIGANTLEMPVAWEQIEPVEGRFDFSWPETLLKEARAHDKRLVLLWFATWKNANATYAPAWVRLNPGRFPRMLNAKGEKHNALSPHGTATQAADERAFVRLMTWLRDNDPQNTIIMVQVQNEAGSYRLARDHAPAADRLFAGPVPKALTARLGKPAGTWTEVFGRDAEAAFQTWYLASYVERIAAAGKAVKKVPMFVNAALPNRPDVWQAPGTYASGGPVPGMLDIWKAAAPSIDVAAPDIYNPDHAAYVGFLDAYRRPDNPLFVPETGNARRFARYFFPTMGRGAIGFSPFGMDETGYFNFPLGAEKLDDETVDAFALNYRIFDKMRTVWPRLALEGKTRGVAEPTDPAARHRQDMLIGRWRATVTFGRPQFGVEEPKGNAAPSGGAVVAALGPDEFLVTGTHARVEFDLAEPGPGEQAHLIRVEEGHYDANGQWQFERVWNGDQIDYGLNFVAAPQLLRVKLATLK